MIIFWIFTLFAGASTFAFTYIFLQLGLAWSIADAFVAMLLCRGLLSMVRRSLILPERISPETDTLTRTVETNRAEDVRGQKAAVTEMRRILRLIEHGRLDVRAGGKRAPIAAVSESA